VTGKFPHLPKRKISYFEKKNLYIRKSIYFTCRKIFQLLSQFQTISDNNERGVYISRCSQFLHL